MFDIHCHFIGTAEACLSPTRKQGKCISANHKHAQTSCCPTVLVFIFEKLDEQAKIVPTLSGCVGFADSTDSFHTLKLLDTWTPLMIRDIRPELVFGVYACCESEG